MIAKMGPPSYQYQWEWKFRLRWSILFDPTRLHMMFLENIGRTVRRVGFMPVLSRFQFHRVSQFPRKVNTHIRNTVASHVWNKNSNYPTTADAKRENMYLPSDRRITTLPADKGEATVVLDIEEYRDKVIH